RDNERRRDQANEQIDKFNEIFKDMSFEISFTDALILMPKFASTIKALIGNKEKLSEMARTPMNEHCSAVILNKFPKKLRDPGKFLIPCEFPGMDECLALADLDRLVSKPIGISRDVSVKVGVFCFPANFVVVDFEPDPQVPLILGSGNPTPYDDLIVSTTSPTLTSFRDSNFLLFKEADAFFGLEDDLNSPKFNPFYYDPEGDILLLEAIMNSEPLPPLPIMNNTCLRSRNNSSPTPSDDPIISTTSPTLTPFGDSDFLLFEEANAFLGLEDDPNSPELDPFYYDPKGDIQMIEAILNSDPAPSLPNHEQFVPSFTNELKACEAKTFKSSIDEPPEVELKDLPPHLEYAFLEGDNKLPVIIAKELGEE
nr:reverse transcriptase domain-containing protein [Tanacetum cinerariifolium]